MNVAGPTVEPIASSEEETSLRGQIESVVYQSADRWTVAVLRTAEDNRSVRITGKLLCEEGDRVVVSGEYVTHDKHGRQFQVRSMRLDETVSAKGLSEYLALHPEVHGIGPAKAKLLVDQFGAAWSESLRERQQEMALAARVPTESIERLAAIWKKGEKKNEILCWLSGLGLTWNQVTSIEAKYGEGSKLVLERNPYLLAREVRGFGFAKADEIAQRVGVAPDSEDRIEAAAAHVVERVQDDGHTWVPFSELAARVRKLLEVSGEANEKIEAVVGRMVMAGQMTGTWLDPMTWALSTPRMLSREREIAFVLRALGRAPNRWKAELEEAREKTEREDKLNASQKSAMGMALASAACVVTGSAGTGKTFTMAAIAERYRAAGLKVELAAPTGKASKRMSEVDELGGQSAQTLHRLLGYDGKRFRRSRGGGGEGGEGEGEGESKLVDADVLLVDEASMVDVDLCYALLGGVDLKRTSLVFFGDPDQLASVGAGAVLRDVIERQVLPTAKLDVVVRQAGVLKEASTSLLGGTVWGSTKRRAAAGKEAEWPWLVCKRTSERAITETVRELVCEKIPGLGFKPEDVQVLAAGYKGDAGVHALNAVLQREAQKRRGVEVDELVQAIDAAKPMVGDRVIQKRNNYELGEAGIMNGAVGWILRQEGSGKSAVWTVRIDDEEVLYEGKDQRDLDLAYALTVHKAQGSEFPVVVVVVPKSHAFILHRNLLYTAVTRAQKMCVLVGDEGVIVSAAKRNTSDKRRTFLGALREREGFESRLLGETEE